MNDTKKDISWSCLSTLYTGDLTFIPFSESVDCVARDGGECVSIGFSAKRELANERANNREIL